jgi:hypothetical protein
VDGEDNDEDGHIDDADPSCAGSQDNEFPVGTPQCGDEEDNDGDGFLGLDDPRCASLLDNDESPFDSVRAQCADEKDNDEDQYVDDLEDPSCAGPRDDVEDPIDPCPKGYSRGKDARASTSGPCIKDVE